jgi:hypothetical protein
LALILFSAWSRLEAEFGRMKLIMEVTKAAEQQAGTYIKGRTFYAFIFLPVELINCGRVSIDRLQLQKSTVSGLIDYAYCGHPKAQ